MVAKGGLLLGRRVTFTGYVLTPGWQRDLNDNKGTGEEKQNSLHQ